LLLALRFKALKALTAKFKVLNRFGRKLVAHLEGAQDAHRYIAESWAVRDWKPPRPEKD
jgi:hypothetical protein